MKKLHRRKFISMTMLLGMSISSCGRFTKTKEKQMVIHHVFFWLKNPNSKEDLDKLIKGLQSLKEINSIRRMHIGVPASTEKREVIDSSYSVSELMFFDDLEGQKIYQDHPVHKKFIETCSGLWEKVVVYDAIDV